VVVGFSFFFSASGSHPDFTSVIWDLGFEVIVSVISFFTRPGFQFHQCKGVLGFSLYCTSVRGICLKF